MELSDRFPLLPEAAAQRLRWLEEHPRAPRFTHPGVDRVTAEGLAAAQAYAEALRAAPPRWQPGEPPDWVGPFIERCCRTTPFYQRYGDPPARLADAPTCDRGDLAHGAHVVNPHQVCAGRYRAGHRGGGSPSAIGRGCVRQ